MGTGKSRLAIELDLESQFIKRHEAVFEYDIAMNHNGKHSSGSCRVVLTLPEDIQEDLLRYDVQFTFDQPVHSDVTVEYVFDIEDELANSILLPQIDGCITSSPIREDHPGQGYFLLGKKLGFGRLQTGTSGSWY